MKFFFYGQRIKGGSQPFNKLVEFINTTEGNLTIGLSSEGGDVGASLFLLELFNANKKRIHLIAAGEIFSAAFDLWVGFRGFKSVFPGTMGMTHMADTTIRVSEKGNYRPEEEEILKNSMSFSEITSEITFPVMTVKQIRTYEEGKDVYFTCDNLRKIAYRQNKKHKARQPEDEG